jgi:hypothetical protein
MDPERHRKSVVALVVVWMTMIRPPRTTKIGDHGNGMMINVLSVQHSVVVVVVLFAYY